MPCDALQPNDLPPKLTGWQGEPLHDADAELDRQNRDVLRRLVVAGVWPESALRALEAKSR